MLTEDEKGKILTEDEMRASKPGDMILASLGRIPFTVTEIAGGHVWGNFLESFIVGECCRICGIMRRRDKKNSPCLGAARITLRGEVTHAD